MYRKLFKLIFDLIFSGCALVLASPIILILWICLTIVNKESGAFFSQQRPGKNAKIFKVIKFKTMTDQKDSEGNLLPDEKRLTKVGKFIRSTSLDELPQLWNVVKGDMSLIGPRPLLPEYLPLYDESQKRRHEVRPGITGWAQVNGRNTISWKQKFEYDIYYVDNMSFILDLKIIYLTIKKVFIREGINSATSATMETFNGKN
ncbi:sugar transferase [Methanobrevibacter sp.]|uniref:sugar transferase n=1 Tax=Methanobrevibacter sp. TaxID=66852 RepID=UPI0038909F22